MIYVLGSTGMLGRYVTKYLNATGLHREDFDATQGIELNLKEGDIVINCVGIIKPFIPIVGRANTIRINALFPQQVADICEQAGAKFIHVCSDCVFSGHKGSYIETDVCDSTDIYAQTKSIHPEYGTIIRSSIIGEDVNEDGGGLMKWIFNCDGGQIDGYTNCIWNGITCLELARIIKEIIDTNNWWTGVRHVNSPDSLSKYDLCKLIIDVYNLNIQVNPVEAGQISGSKISDTMDRTLSSIHSWPNCTVSSVNTQLHKLKDFNICNKYF